MYKGVIAMYVLLTKRRIAVILAVLILGIILAGQFLSAASVGVDISTNEKRVQYIATLGVKLKGDDFTQRQVTIPQKFSEVYNKYNTLQQKAGFNLQNYRGKEVVIYTYNTDSQLLVNLISYKGKLIGGDIASPRIDGQMTALKEKKNGKRTF